LKLLRPPCRAAVTWLGLATLLAASACSSPPPAKRHVLAPGFKGKDCAMVSPELTYEQMRGPPGTVKVHVKIVDGTVDAVTVRSGPQIYRQPVVEAVKKYTCKGAPTFEADQTFVFNSDPLATKGRK
jgi:hypothetical protein